MNEILTYKERVLWFYRNHYESGMKYKKLLTDMVNENLDIFKWYDDIISIPKTKTEVKELYNKDIVEWWKNIKPFKDVFDIPQLPKVDHKQWKEFFVPRIIELGGIAKKDLIDGATYRGKTRNATIAMWDEKNADFIHYRYSFGDKYRDKVNHFEDDNGYALFVPIKLLRKY